MKCSKLIALDYDNTYDADPPFWNTFITLSRQYQHSVIIITYRDERHDWTDLLEDLVNRGVEVYCTRGVAKKWWWEQFGDGRKVDWWIDDNPLAILENSKADRAWLEAWRRDDNHLKDPRLSRTRVETELAKAS